MTDVDLHAFTFLAEELLAGVEDLYAKTGCNRDCLIPIRVKPNNTKAIHKKRYSSFPSLIETQAPQVFRSQLQFPQNAFVNGKY